MSRLASITEFSAFQRASMRDVRGVPTLVIPAGTCGQASGATRLVHRAKHEILSKGLAAQLRLRVTGCHGFCEQEPSVLLEPHGFFYPKVKPEQMPQIVAAAARGETVEALLYADPATGRRIARQEDIPFFKGQKRTILALSEKVDPTKIRDYLAIGGYTAFVSALEKARPASILEAVHASGLRGRGGGGFRTALKWEMLAKQSGPKKFLVCNADEGDPGAYMDRSVLEGNPHRILEGMLIGAYATGATEGVIYVRCEYPLAIKHLSIALRQARHCGLLGRDILGTGFSFDISLAKGAGAFVCGEETALIRSIEGKMGEPRQRPPYPVQKGIEGHPTVINNVETWANVPEILTVGAAQFAAVGTKQSTGTKIFSLVGKVRNTGLIEVPMGIPLKDIVFGIGGGPSGKRPVKAVQTGGPSGGCLPVNRFDLPVDYDSLASAGSIMGSGGMIVMDEGTCMVDLARYFMKFLKDESCGKCFTCRKGTQRLFELLDDVTQGRGTPEHLSLLEELACTVRDASMCGLGQTAPNPVLSTLRYFREEYLAHVRDRRCPAGVCKALTVYAIAPHCKGCHACVRACPNGAVSGRKNELHVIDPSACTQCGACMSACKFDAVAIQPRRATVQEG